MTDPCPSWQHLEEISLGKGGITAYRLEPGVMGDRVNALELRAKANLGLRRLDLKGLWFLPRGPGMDLKERVERVCPGLEVLLPPYAMDIG